MAGGRTDGPSDVQVNKTVRREGRQAWKGDVGRAISRLPVLKEARAGKLQVELKMYRLCWTLNSKLLFNSVSNRSKKSISSIRFSFLYFDRNAARMKCQKNEWNSNRWCQREDRLSLFSLSLSLAYWFQIGRHKVARAREICRRKISRPNKLYAVYLLSASIQTQDRLKLATL